MASPRNGRLPRRPPRLQHRTQPEPLLRALIRDFRTETEGRPFLALLGLVYAVIPFFLIFVGVYTVLHRNDVATEAHRNCQRTMAIANYIHGAVGPKPDRSNPQVVRILDLQHTLETIGSCPKP